MDRLVQFMAAAISDRGQKLVKVDEQTYDLVLADDACRARFTLNRETATNDEKVELLGLDHPLVQEELGRWRSLAPENLGIVVSGDGPAMLSLWIVEISTGKGERRVILQAIAAQPDGTRTPAVERQCEHYLRAPPSAPAFTAEERIELFARVVEPTLQRELKHKGSANGDGSYAAELIGYVEIC